NDLFVDEPADDLAPEQKRAGNLRTAGLFRAEQRLARDVRLQVDRFVVARPIQIVEKRLADVDLDLHQRITEEVLRGLPPPVLLYPSRLLGGRLRRLPLFDQVLTPFEARGVLSFDDLQIQFAAVLRPSEDGWSPFQLADVDVAPYDGLTERYER